MKRFIKDFLRSKSLGFALARTRPVDGTLGMVRAGGHPMHYRIGTSDHQVLYEVLMKGRRSAYASPHLPRFSAASPGAAPLIVDAGANIGASVLFFKQRYPAARVFAFEPVPANFALLQRNVGALPGVHVYNEALGERDQELELIASPQAANIGGWSLYQRGATGKEARLSVPVRGAGPRLRELGVNRIDILKLDTEGAEQAIIAGFDERLLARTGLIIGELHGERDFLLLDRLEVAGFAIEAKKSLRRPLFIFLAKRPQARLTNTAPEGDNPSAPDFDPQGMQ